MKGKFILISGSSSYSCPQAKMSMAIDFLCCFTRETLNRGGGFVVLGSDERATNDEHGIAHVFDWIVLREVEKYAETTVDLPRPYAHVVMSDDTVERKIDDANLRLLTKLEQRNAVKLHYIQRERFTGGEYRKAQVEWADAMLGIGGGKGTYSIGREMTELGKPVLPMDLSLGPLNEDGEGAVGLHREMLLNPNRFFPKTYSDVINRTVLMALNRGVNDTEGVAQVAAEVIEREFDSIPQETSRAKALKQLVRAWQVAKALPVVSSAIKIIESILRSTG